MYHHKRMKQHHYSVSVPAIAAGMFLAICVWPAAARAQTITKIIDGSGDGAGNFLLHAEGIAVDAAGNVYVVGLTSDNAFKITPGGVITEIIDATGGGAGNVFDSPIAIAVDVAGNVYVVGLTSDNAFKITPGGVITEIIDSTGDGAGNTLNLPSGLAVDGSGNVYAAGGAGNTSKVFKITAVE